jgi:bifunctional enzyme CysN/CysC
MAYDSYTRNRNTGCFVLIDRVSNATVAAGMILDRDPNELLDDSPRGEPRSKNIQTQASQVTADERAARLDQTPSTIWLTGLPKSGKSSIAYALERKLFDQGKFAVVLDGENLRGSISSDLGFSASDRRENVRRAAAAAKLLNDNGITAIVATVSPYADDRANARAVLSNPGSSESPSTPTTNNQQQTTLPTFLEVYVDTPLDECKKRDTDGLYAKAESGEIEHFSGVTAPYEPPTAPDLTIETTTTDVATAVTTIVTKLNS